MGYAAYQFGLVNGTALAAGAYGLPFPAKIGDSLTCYNAHRTGFRPTRQQHRKTIH